MERLAAEGLEAIVVGIPNAEEMRPVEYSPFVDPDRVPTDGNNPYGGVDPRGDVYADWLVETIIPPVERQFRTTGKRGLFGSSLGGLISLYAFFRDPDRFAFVGAMSPAVGGPWQEIFECIEATGHVDGRIYVDVGGEEFPDNSDRSTEFESGARRLVEVLESAGYEENLRFVYDADAVHHEDAWAERFPDAIRFLL
jgi:predicted alpha/beta superfamily hydrolase